MVHWDLCTFLVAREVDMLNCGWFCWLLYNPFNSNGILPITLQSFAVLQSNCNRVWLCQDRIGRDGLQKMACDVSSDDILSRPGGGLKQVCDGIVLNMQSYHNPLDCMELQKIVPGSARIACNLWTH